MLSNAIGKVSMEEGEVPREASTMSGAFDEVTIGTGEAIPPL